MSHLYGELVAGAPMRRALAAARARLLDDARPAAVVAAGGFVCFGAG